MEELAAYKRAIDDIDDYFEYRCESITDRKFVQYILEMLVVDICEVCTQCGLKNGDHKMDCTQPWLDSRGVGS